VVVNEDRPYRNAERYRTQYAGYKNNHSQQVIRNSHEEKYFEIKNHPEHDKWKGNNGRGNGRDERGNGRNERDNGRKGRGNDDKRNDHDNK
jgi:hypothetical protein